MEGNGLPAPREFHVKVRSLLAPGSVTTHLTPRAFNIQGLRPPDEFGGMQIPDAEGAAEPFMSRRRCRHEEDSPDQISSAAGSDCASGKRRCSRCGKSEMTQGLFAGLPCNSSKDAADLSFSTFGSEAFHAIDSMECISQLGWLQHCALTRRRILSTLR